MKPEYGDAHRTTLTGLERDEFIRTFAPALLQVLRQSGEPAAREEDVRASLSDPASTIEFETPPRGGKVMAACVITDLHLVNGDAVEVVIRRKER